MSIRLSERAMIVSLHIGGRPPKARTNTATTKDVKAQKNLGADAGHWTDNLYPPKAFDEIITVDYNTRIWNNAHCSPWDDNSRRVLAAEMFSDHSQFMRDQKRKYFDAVEAFVAKRDEYVAWARVELNGSFNEALYPTAETMRSKFYFEVEFEPMPEEGDFRVKLQDEQIAEIKEGAMRAATSRVAGSVRELWERLAKPLRLLIPHLRGETERDASGAQIANLNELVDLIPKMNFVGDPELDRIALEIKREIAGQNADSLKRDTKARKAVALKADEILSRMSAYTKGA